MSIHGVRVDTHMRSGGTELFHYRSETEETLRNLEHYNFAETSEL